MKNKRKVLTFVTLVFPGIPFTVLAFIMSFSGGILPFFWGVGGLLGIVGLLMSLCDQFRKLAVVLLSIGVVAYLPVGVAGLSGMLNNPFLGLVMLLPLICTALFFVETIRSFDLTTHSTEPPSSVRSA